MSRVPWREGKVVSIETRPGVFALGQMVGPHYMFFFDAFHSSLDWPEMSLDDLPVLHVVSVVNQFISRSNAKYQKHLFPAKVDLPCHRIAPNSQPVIRTIWTGSPYEMTVGYIGAKASLIDGQRRVLMPAIDPQDSQTIDSHNLSGLVAYPFQNERLYLCHLLGRDVDVMKDLIFRRELPIEYETFLKYLSIPSEQVREYKPGSVEVDPRIPHGQMPHSELNSRTKRG